MYCTVERRKHKHLTVKETGLRLLGNKPFMLCSIDGLAVCKCDGHIAKVVEIKCPYAQCKKHPRDAALEKHCMESNDGKLTLKKSSSY